MKLFLIFLSLVFLPMANSFELSKEQALVHAQKIDSLVFKAMSEQGVYYRPRVGDDIYVRRIYLDLIGRIPTWKEAQDFILSPRVDKHYRITDKLLGSEGYVSHNFHYWADLLRAVSRVDGGATGASYIQWIKNAIADNKPYDQMVYELLASQGSPYQNGNGAVGYYLRDPGMPLDNMANTMQVFLGTSIGCAQCHDHPFAQWSQMDFYKLAAFSGGMKTRQNDKKSGMIRKLVKNEDRQFQQQMNRYLRNLSYGVQGAGTGLMRLPENYAYTDAKPNDKVFAQVPFGHKVHMNIPKQPIAATGKKVKADQEVDSRHHFANWVTDKTNPRFTLVIANRMWKKVMGRGLIEPVDDITEKTKASHPELMDYLVKLMLDVDYDLRSFQKVLTQTRAYQSEAREEPLKETEKYFYDGPMVSRLHSEQVWDSLIGLVVPEIDNRKLEYKSGSKNYYDFKLKSPEEIVANAKAEILRAEKFKENQKKYQDFKRTIDRRRRQLSEALKGARKSKNKAKEAQLVKEIKGLADRLKKARNYVETFKKNKAKGGYKESAVYAGYSRSLVRASELPSPAKAGHFLRQFGQSERQTIQAATQDANVTQVLSLLNGFVDTNIINNDRAVLMKDVAGASTEDEKLKIIFLSLFSRYPAAREKSMMLAHVHAASHKKKAWEDIVWAMINTNEFMFRR